MGLFDNAKFSKGMTFETHGDFLASQALTKKLGSKQVSELKSYELNHLKRIEILKAWKADPTNDIVGIDQDNYQCLKQGLDHYVEDAVWLFTKKVVFLKPGASTWLEKLVRVMETELVLLGYDENKTCIFGLKCFEDTFDKHQNKRTKNWRADAAGFVKAHSHVVNEIYLPNIKKLYVDYVDQFDMIGGVLQ